MLEVSNLHLWRGDRQLLRGASFSLSARQALQLLWPNGTGKTSLLRCIAGFLHAEEGELKWQARRIADDRDQFNWDVAYLGHETALKGDLTAFENLRFSCALRVPLQPAQLQAALQRVGLGGMDPDQPVRSFSAGQQRRVALARLSLWDARLWLLDEPASNLDSAGQALIADLLQWHLQDGGMAIIATHQGIQLPGADCRYWLAPQEAP